MNINKLTYDFQEAERELVEALINRPAESLERYHAIVGEIRGLRKAGEIIAQHLADD